MGKRGSKYIVGTSYHDNKVQLVEILHCDKNNGYFGRFSCLWNYQNCKGEFVTAIRTVANNITKSCGCYSCHLVVARRKDLLKSNINKKFSPENREKYSIKFLSDIDKVFVSYKRHAVDKNREFQLSRDEFLRFVTGSCHYCGAQPSNGEFFGIDRIDNNIGYVMQNCVSCCKRDNYAKRDLSHDEFIKMCEEIVKYKNINHGR